MKKIKSLAISQIIILVVGIVAVAYAIGSEVKLVSGASEPTCSINPKSGQLGTTFEVSCQNFPTNPLLNIEVIWPSGKSETLISGQAKISDGKFSFELPTSGPDETGIYKAKISFVLTYIINPIEIPFEVTENTQTNEAIKQSTQSSQTGTLPNPVVSGIVGDGIRRAFDKYVGWDKFGLGSKTGTAATSGAETASTAVTKKPNVPFFVSWWKAIPAPIQNFGKAAAIYFTIKSGLNMLGADKELSEAASRSAAYGYYAATTIKWAIAKYGAGHAAATATTAAVPGTLWGYSAGAWGTGIGIGVAVGWFLYSYKTTKTEKIVFDCKPWQAATGGSKCNDCNTQGILGCNEYQCRSLGQSCQLVNKGTSEEKCAWVNQKDVTPPEIKADDSALLSDYKYSSKTATGVKIDYAKSDDKCIPPFTPFTFGISTNELSMCKIDYQRKNKFEDMTYDFGGSNLLVNNHTELVSLPGPSALEEGNLTVGGGGNYELFVRCQDANGNKNTADFVFKFCVDKGPDSTAPVIEATSLLNGMPVSFGTQKINLDVYTNEVASCKWSLKDQDYKNMEHTMLCASNETEINPQMLYTCTAKLEDLKDRQENKFYFRCKDIKENTNTESYKFILKGSQPLVIDSVGPNETIKDSTAFVTVTLEAKTSAGYNEGEAICEYSEDGEKYIDEFFETHSYKHKQDLALSKGSYTFYIKCFDLAGNSDVKTVSFSVESDPYAPAIVRAYYEDNNLKLTTDEKAECVYSTFSCSYDFDKDGTKITTSDGKIHLTYWNPKTNFYVKCKDEYDNQPNPNECSIAIKPLKI